jgi:hypothetical protein
MATKARANRYHLILFFFDGADPLMGHITDRKSVSNWKTKTTQGHMMTIATYRHKYK